MGLVYAALGEQAVHELHTHGTEHRPQEGLVHPLAIMQHLRRDVEPGQAVAQPSWRGVSRGVARAARALTPQKILGSGRDLLGRRARATHRYVHLTGHARLG